MKLDICMEISSGFFSICLILREATNFVVKKESNKNIGICFIFGEINVMWRNRKSIFFVNVVSADYFFQVWFHRYEQIAELCMPSCGVSESECLCIYVLCDVNVAI